MRVGELLFWGCFAKKYEPFGESRIQFGESDIFWQNLKRFGETLIQSGKTLYNLAKVGSFAKLYSFISITRNIRKRVDVSFFKNIRHSTALRVHQNEW